MFGDPRQHQHMMDGVKRAAASPKTPEHLRPHLQKRLGGSMAFPTNRPGNRVMTGSTGRVAVETRDGLPSSDITGQRPIKTIVGSTARTPIKTIAGTPRMDTRPLKTLVGNTAAPPIKTKVGRTAGPPIKTRVGSTSAPPRKTTPTNLGTGGINPLGMDAADRGPINAGNPSMISRALTSNGDGNLGRSVGSTPPPAPGPANASMDWAHPWGFSAVQDGGMGPAAKAMAPPARPRGVSPRRPEEGGMRDVQISGGAGFGRRGPSRQRSQFFGE